MASVPRLTRPETVLRPVPGQVAPAVDPFASASNPIAQGLANVAGVIQRERQYNDEIRVNEATADYTARLDAALTGRDGILQQRGTNAVSKFDGFRDRASMALSEVESGLATDEQKLLFRRAAAQRQQSALARADAHVGGEMRRADTESHAALLGQDMEAVTRDASNDLAVQATLNGLRERILTYADRNGIPPEAAQQQVRTAVSGARLTQVNALVNAGNTEQAALTIAEWSDVFTPADRAKAENAVAEAQERGTIESAASRILASATTATEAYEMTKGIADLGTRQSVRKLVEAEFAAKEEAQKRDQEQVYTSAANLVDAAPGKPARAVVPPSQWAQLSVTQREALERRATAPANDNKAWFQFYSMRPEDRAKLTPAQFQTDYWSKFDETHRTRAESLYKESASDATGTGSSAGIMTDNERVRSTLVSMHLVSKPQQKDWSEEDYLFATAFEQEADTRIRALEQTKNGRATPTEKDQIITTLGWQMSPVSIRGGTIFGLPRSDRETTQLQAVQEGAGYRTFVPFDKVPVVEQQRIRQAMQQNGVTPTNRMIEDAYGALVMGFRGRYERLIKPAVPE